MKKIIKYIILIIDLILVYYLLLANNWLVYNMTYIKTLFFLMSISLFVYITGIVFNEEKEYKINIYCYIILFLILLFSFTFIIGRPMFMYYEKSPFYTQLKPFYTISTIMKNGSTKTIIKNILGNCIALIPLSFLLMIKDKKYNNVLRQTLIIIPIIIFIELFQGYSHTGAFDVDDIILNYLGVVVFTLSITRFNIIDKIRKLFYTDYKLYDKTKNLLFYISIVLIILISGIMLIK